MATKHQQFFDLMLKQNKEVFDQFREIHDSYAADPQKWQAQFNEVGRDIQDVVRRYENMLCSKSEGSGYGKYSTNLSEKFQAEVRKLFPKFDFIGAE